MQAPQALQEHVGRACIRDHEVRIDVEALLRRLGRHDHKTARGAPWP